MLRARTKVLDILKSRLAPQRALTSATKYSNVPAALKCHRNLVAAHTERKTPRLASLHRGVGNSAKPDGPLAATSFPDPVRPDLYYHLVGPPTPGSDSQPAFALSFLPAPPRTPDSCAVIGWLPAIRNRENGQGCGEMNLNDFRENRKFRDFLHTVIQDGLGEGVDEIQVNSAIQLQHGWLHIHDERNIPPLGRVGDPCDIIASVLVEDGKILAETYQPMPAYRLYTTDGVTKLTPGLATKLQSLLERQGIITG